jgi:hypothetical protein
LKGGRRSERGEAEEEVGGEKLKKWKGRKEAEEAD